MLARMNEFRYNIYPPTPEYKTDAITGCCTDTNYHSSQGPGVSGEAEIYTLNIWAKEDATP